MFYVFELLEGLHRNGSMDKNMAELMANLQDLRTENRELKQSVEQRLQEVILSPTLYHSLFFHSLSHVYTSCYPFLDGRDAP